MSEPKTMNSTNKAMKIILTIFAVAVGLIQTVARAAEEPAWSNPP